MESHHRLEIRLTLDPLSLHSTFIVNGEPTAQKTFQQVDCAELWLATLQSIAQATVVSEGQALPLQQGTRYAAHILGQSQDNAHKRPKRKGSDPKIPQLPTPSTTTASSPNFAETSIFTVEQINPREHNNPQPSLFPDTLSWMEIEPPVINYSENLNIGNARNSWRSSSVPNESSSSTTEHDHVFTVASGSDSNSVSTAPSPHGVASARIESIECAPQTAPIKWVDTLQSASQSATHKRRPNRNKSISRLPRGNFERTLQAPVDAVRSPSPIPLNAIDQRASTCIERMNKLKRSLESIRQAPVPTMRDHNEKVRSIYTRCKYSSAIVPQSPEEFGQLLGELGGVSSALGVVYGLLSWEVFRREEQRLVREEHLSPRWAAKRVNDKMAQQSNRHARTKDWASDGRRAAEMVFDALQGLSAGSRSCALFSLSDVITLDKLVKISHFPALREYFKVHFREIHQSLGKKWDELTAKGYYVFDYEGFLRTNMQPMQLQLGNRGRTHTSSGAVRTGQKRMNGSHDVLGSQDIHAVFGEFVDMNGSFFDCYGQMR